MYVSRFHFFCMFVKPHLLASGKVMNYKCLNTKLSAQYKRDQVSGAFRVLYNEGLHDLYIRVGMSVDIQQEVTPMHPSFFPLFVSYLPHTLLSPVFLSHIFQFRITIKISAVTLLNVFVVYITSTVNVH
jgi:hypothetical protein